MKKCRQLTQQLRSFDNQKVLWAVDELRKKGWLDDGALNGLEFCHVNLSCRLSGLRAGGMSTSPLNLTAVEAPKWVYNILSLLYLNSKSLPGGILLLAPGGF